MGRCLTRLSFNFKVEEWHERTRKIYLLLYISSATDFLLSSFLAYVCDKSLKLSVASVSEELCWWGWDSKSSPLHLSPVGIGNKDFISFSHVFGPSSHASSQFLSLLSFPQQPASGMVFLARSRQCSHPLPCSSLSQLAQVAGPACRKRLWLWSAPHSPDVDEKLILMVSKGSVSAFQALSNSHLCLSGGPGLALPLLLLRLWGRIRIPITPPPKNCIPPTRIVHVDAGAELFRWTLRRTRAPSGPPAGWTNLQGIPAS